MSKGAAAGWASVPNVPNFAPAAAAAPAPAGQGASPAPDERRPSQDGGWSARLQGGVVSALDPFAPLKKVVGEDAPANASASAPGAAGAVDAGASDALTTTKSGRLANSEPEWELNLGPLALGHKGMELKPQLRVGAKVGNFRADAGIHDVRDGLKVSLKASAILEVIGEGHNIDELHDSIRCETPGFREAMDSAKALLGRTSNKAGSVISKVSEIIGIGNERLEKLLAGKDEMTKKKHGNTPLELKVKGDVGIGVTGAVCLGWCDTKGFHMVGVGGTAAAALAVGVNVFAGKHGDGTCFKLILGLSNFCFEYIIPLGEVTEEPVPADPQATQASDAGAVDLLDMGPPPSSAASGAPANAPPSGQPPLDLLG